MYAYNLALRMRPARLADCKTSAQQAVATRKFRTWTPRCRLTSSSRPINSSSSRRSDGHVSTRARVHQLPYTGRWKTLFYTQAPSCFQAGAMSTGFFFYSLTYFLLSSCIVYPPNEFVSAGLTIKNIFSELLGNENEFFIQYHIRRSMATLLVHSMLPFGQ